MTSKEEEQKAINDYRLPEKDIGSPEVQIVILTHKISGLNEHLKGHKEDHHSHRGLLKTIDTHKNLSRYLQRKDTERYRSLIERLNVRGQ